MLGALDLKNFTQILKVFLLNFTKSNYLQYFTIKRDFSLQLYSHETTNHSGEKVEGEEEAWSEAWVKKCKG